MVKDLLYIVATPIGNLDDLSPRAIQTLNLCDAVLCEDTRHSRVLLERHGIKKKLISYHKFKEREALEKVLEELKAGKNLALVSDAGTPCINDPGQILVEACAKRNIGISAIPGPCSLIQALVLSGFETDRFQFVGFLPRKGEKGVRQALSYPGTTVAFESPERLLRSLEAIARVDGERRVAVARELTKMFEECRRGTARELAVYFKEKPARGEVVLVIGGGGVPDELTLEECVEMLQEWHGLSLKEAIKEAAKMKKMAKREIYRKFHRSDKIDQKNHHRGTDE